MDVPDAIGVAPHAVQGVAATVEVVGGVEAQADELRPGEAEEGLDLGRGLDKAGAVVVEHGRRPTCSLTARAMRCAPSAKISH
jgi:hypothetical protein